MDPSTANSSEARSFGYKISTGMVAPMRPIFTSMTSIPHEASYGITIDSTSCTHLI